MIPILFRKALFFAKWDGKCKKVYFWQNRGKSEKAIFEKELQNFTQIAGPMWGLYYMKTSSPTPTPEELFLDIGGPSGVLRADSAKFRRMVCASEQSWNNPGK